MAKTLDLRQIPVIERKTQVESLLPLVQPGEELTVLADQDLKPVFQGIDPSKLVRALRVFELESGPLLWKFSVVAAEEGHARGGCCGSCGG